MPSGALLRIAVTIISGVSVAKIRESPSQRFSVFSLHMETSVMLAVETLNSQADRIATVVSASAIVRSFFIVWGYYLFGV